MMVQLDFEPEGFRETAGSWGDLERFSELVDGRGVESGAWRGPVEEGTRVG